MRGAVAAQEVVNPIDRMVGDVGRQVAQPSLELNPVELGCADQRIDRGRPFATAVSTCDLVVAPADGCYV